MQVGDDLELVNSDRGETFAKAVIVEIIYKNLGEVDDIDLDGHEKWQNKEEMLESLKGYYGKKVSWDTEVKIVKFKLL